MSDDTDAARVFDDAVVDEAVEVFSAEHSPYDGMRAALSVAAGALEGALRERIEQALDDFYESEYERCKAEWNGVRVSPEDDHYLQGITAAGVRAYATLTTT